MRHGDPLAGLAIRRGSLLDRFLARVTHEGECWIWTAGKNAKGYGVFSLMGQGYAQAHRWSYEQFVGPIPEGLQIDHLCRNRACVRPDHLEAVTQSENQRRGYSFSGINGRKTRCIRGHDLTNPENVYGYKDRRQCKLCARAAARAKFIDPETRESALAAKREANRRAKQRRQG